MNSDSLTVIIPAVLLVLIMIVRRLSRRHRSKQIEGIAVKLGYEFQKFKKDDLWVDLHSGNHRRRIGNLVIAEQARIPFVVYDFSYNNRKWGHTYKTRAQFRSDAFTLPKFTLRPTDWKDKVNSAMGLKDINFDSHPEFSKLYQLKGENESAIRALLKPELLTFLAQKKGWTLESEGNNPTWLLSTKTPENKTKLIIHYGDKLLPTNDLEQFLKDVEYLVELLKWQE